MVVKEQSVLFDGGHVILLGQMIWYVLLLLRELLSVQLIPVLVSCAPNLFCFNFLGCQSV